MQESQAPLQESMPPRKGFTSRHKTRLTAGLILALPIWITIFLLSVVFGIMRDASIWLLEAALGTGWGGALLGHWEVTAQQVAERGYETLPIALRWCVSLIAVFLTVGGVYVLGMVTTNIVGRRLVQAIEKLVDRVPFVKTIYRASKQVLETFAGESGQSFQRVVSVPFPSERVRTVGFITRVTRNPASGEDLCAVFMPTAPNPTTGFVLFVDRRDLIDLNWTVEEAVKVAVSGGVLLPDTAPSTGASHAEPESPAAGAP